MREETRISSGVDLTILIASSLVGAGIIELPKALAAVAGPDAWLSVILAWAGAILGVVAITQVMRRFPGRTIISLLDELWGPVVGRIVGLVFALYLTTALAVTVRSGAEDVKIGLMSRTPMEFLVLSYLAVAVYLARESLPAVVRAMTLLFPLLGVGALVILLASHGSDFRNLLPVLEHGLGPVAQAAILAGFSFLGFEGLLIWMAAVDRPDKATRSAVIGVTIAGALYLLFVLVTLTVFTPRQTAHLALPLKAVTDAIEMPGILFERFDVLSFTVWISVIFASIVIQLHLIGRFLQEVLGFRSHTPLILFLVPIVYALALQPANTEETDAMINIVGRIGLGLGIAFPVLLWIIVPLRARALKRSRDR